jgi:hypothetical protein
VTGTAQDVLFRGNTVRRGAQADLTMYVQDTVRDLAVVDNDLRDGTDQTKILNMPAVAGIKTNNLGVTAA